MINKLTQFVKDNQNDIVLIIGIILISLISFGAGRLFEAGRLTNQPINYGSEKIINIDQNIAAESPTPSPNKNPNQQTPQIQTDSAGSLQIIGNKSSKIYHYPWCSGAKNMKEENKIFFNSTEEAKKAGFKPAGNCPGL